MHAGGAPNGLANTYSLINGRMFVTGSINVVWQLHDVGPDDGGFVVSLQISIVKLNLTLAVWLSARLISMVRWAAGDARAFLWQIVPGSHKTSLQIPERVMWCHDTTTVRHVEASAGDVVLCECKPPPRPPCLCIISELVAGV